MYKFLDFINVILKEMLNTPNMIPLYRMHSLYHLFECPCISFFISFPFPSSPSIVVVLLAPQISALSPEWMWTMTARMMMPMTTMKRKKSPKIQSALCAVVTRDWRGAARVPLRSTTTATTHRSATRPGAHGGVSSAPAGSGSGKNRAETLLPRPDLEHPHRGRGDRQPVRAGHQRQGETEAAPDHGGMFQVHVSSLIPQIDGYLYSHQNLLQPGIGFLLMSLTWI